MNRRRLISILLLTTSLMCHGTLARAALIVTVGNLNLREGGSGFVDVMISSSDGSDLLDLFAIDLLISPGPGVTSQLKFFDLGGGIPSDTHLTDSDYLFSGDGLGFGGLLLSSTLYSGGDGTSSGSGVSVPTTDTLLVRLEVTAATSSPPVVGDTFTIGVDFAEFSDPSFEEILFTSFPGTVTITSSSAVIPEPASMAIWAILLAVSMIGMGRCRRTRPGQLKV